MVVLKLDCTLESPRDIFKKILWLGLTVRVSDLTGLDIRIFNRHSK